MQTKIENADQARRALTVNGVYAANSNRIHVTSPLHHQIDHIIITTLPMVQVGYNTHCQYNNILVHDLHKPPVLNV